ncbi:uncharacterized protein TM35_000112210 [Trypanosoma theileri]|uniref:Uncharacterized protein n=1 Tax=Trypanosoma theileri TaxID=67003 RepID=A0A1X0NYD5_9TRYP|nr:uncharacterized protein TM35_000112210 [Trypanosoma theileri]ORC89687.1 hypothetical protein TM35_000112210 [Trypanosoma theileri]
MSVFGDLVVGGEKKKKDYTMATSRQHDHCMKLLSSHNLRDRYLYTEILLEQSRFSRTPPPVKCSTTTTTYTPAYKSLRTSRLSFHQISSPSSEGFTHTWHSAGKAGRSNYFSVPTSNLSRSSLMELEARREERRRIESLRRKIDNE